MRTPIELIMRFGDGTQATARLEPKPEPAALAEHFAIHYQLPIPRWVNEPERFLEQWWFPTQFKSLHAQAIVESPAAFRRRGIFVDKTEFQRC